MSTLRIAIFEDNASLRGTLSRLVESAPDMKLVGAFSSCENVVEDLTDCEPSVVLMDIGLPNLSGIEGARLAKQAFPELDVLMLTVHEDEDRIFASICAGASGYLLKKTPSTRILDALREAHRGGAPMSPAVARRVLRMFKRNIPRRAADCELSPREREVLAHLVEGHTYQQVALLCHVSLDTVRTHVRHIYEKLHVHSKSQAVVEAIRRGLV